MTSVFPSVFKTAKSVTVSKKDFSAIKYCKNT